MALGRKEFERTEHTGSYGPRGYHPRAWRKAVSRKVRRWNDQREIADVDVPTPRRRHKRT